MFFPNLFGPADLLGPAELLGKARPRRPAAARRRVAVGVETAADLLQIFYEEYRELRPRAALPAIEVSFYRFVRINNTIRLRDGTLHVRLSDTLQDAPEAVLRALAQILLAKLYRKPVAAKASAVFRSYVGSAPVSRQAERVRQARGRKRGLGARGSVYDLDEVFERLNRQFFHGLLARPVLTWSEHKARRMLGHYDAAHNTIMVSRILDQPRVPEYVVEYLVYHEMLHLVHPVTMRGGRRCVHSQAFQAEERRFPRLQEATAFLRGL